MATIKIDDLAKAITEELSAYNQEVTDGMKRDVKEVAKECAAEIKLKSPTDTGKYRRGWRQKVMYESKDDIRVYVYNYSAPQLTHLLEYGHAKVNGGRVDGTPHIRPAEENVEKKLMQKVKVVVKG